MISCVPVRWPDYTVGHLTPKKRREGWRPARVQPPWISRESSNLNFSPKFSPSGSLPAYSILDGPCSLIGVARNRRFSGLFSDRTTGGKISLNIFQRSLRYLHTMRGGQSRDVSYSLHDPNHLPSSHLSRFTAAGNRAVSSGVSNLLFSSLACVAAHACCQKSANHSLAEKRALCLHDWIDCARSGIQTNRKLQKKTGGKPKEANPDDSCRFCRCNLRVAGSKSSCENLFLNHRVDRKVVRGSASPLAQFSTEASQTLSERVCRPCVLKIRNTAKLYNFIKRYAIFWKTRRCRTRRRQWWPEKMALGEPENPFSEVKNEFWRQ